MRQRRGEGCRWRSPPQMLLNFVHEHYIWFSLFFCTCSFLIVCFRSITLYEIVSSHEIPAHGAQTMCLVIKHVQSSMCTQTCAIKHAQSTICNQRCAIKSAQSKTYNQRCAIENVQSNMCNPKFAVTNVQSRK